MIRDKTADFNLICDSIDVETQISQPIRKGYVLLWGEMVAQMITTLYQNKYIVVWLTVRENKGHPQVDTELYNERKDKQQHIQPRHYIYGDPPKFYKKVLNCI